MTSAYRAALDEAGIELNRVGYRIADLIGEQYWFKQTALASLRLDARAARRSRTSGAPARSLGNVGAAVVPADDRHGASPPPRKGYAAGNPVLIEASSDAGACGAALFRAARARLMYDVFANGLEISGKAVSAQDHRRLPRRLLHAAGEPRDAARRAGPLSELRHGLGHRQGHRHRQDRRQDRQHQEQVLTTSKTTGTEAGCAAEEGRHHLEEHRQGVLQLLVERREVRRRAGHPSTDLATNNHASPVGNTPPMVHAARLNVDGISCKAIFERHDLELHRHGDSKCDSSQGSWSEHFVENRFMDSPRGTTRKQFKNYNVDDAPCVCMHSKWTEGDDTRPADLNVGQTTGTGHYKKTRVCADKLKEDPEPNLGEFADTCGKASADNHEKTRDASDEEREQVGKCLVAVFLAHLEEVLVPKKTQAEIRQMKR